MRVLRCCGCVCCILSIPTVTDERTIKGQLPKVLLPMIGIPGGAMGGKNS